MNLLTCFKSFIAIVNYRSFSAAARKLYVSPSKLSKQITWLEEELKTQLFHRSTRRLQLTKSGELLYQKASQWLNELSEIKNQVCHLSNEPQGVIRIHMMITTVASYFSALVVKFMALYPKIHCKFLVGDDLLVDVTDQAFDLAIVSRKVNHPLFISHRWIDIRRRVFGSPLYLKKNGVPKKPEDLLQYNCLIHTHPDIQNKWILGGKAIYVAGNFQSNDFNILKQVALAGTGLIWIPPFTINEEIKTKQLCLALSKYNSPKIPLFAVIPKFLANSVNMQFFLKFLISEVAKDNI
jgi:DNA-binding transcriptional LysR family regulator